MSALPKFHQILNCCHFPLTQTISVDVDDQSIVSISTSSTVSNYVSSNDENYGSYSSTMSYESSDNNSNHNILAPKVTKPTYLKQIENQLQSPNTIPFRDRRNQLQQIKKHNQLSAVSVKNPRTRPSSKTPRCIRKPRGRSRHRRSDQGSSSSRSHHLCSDRLPSITMDSPMNKEQLHEFIFGDPHLIDGEDDDSTITDDNLSSTTSEIEGMNNATLTCRNIILELKQHKICRRNNQNVTSDDDSIMKVNNNFNIYPRKTMKGNNNGLLLSIHHYDSDSNQNVDGDRYAVPLISQSSGSTMSVDMSDKGDKSCRLRLDKYSQCGPESE